MSRIYSEFNDISKKIIVKEPNGSHGADIISASLPKSKFILIIRDCRDIIDSGLDSMKKGGWRANWQEHNIKDDQRLSFVEKEARTLKSTWEVAFNAYEQHANDLKYIVHYEDLRENTYQEVKKLYKFLEIEIDDDNLKKLVEKSSFENIPEDQKGSCKHARSATPGLWKSNLKQSEIELIHEILGSMLKKFGYTVN